MRKALLIAGVVADALILIGGALVVYAYFNLASIIASNENRIVARVSDALGRRVEAGKIQAHIGWGVSAAVAGLKIADDPAFSKKPFLTANTVSVELEFMPLLHGEAKVTRLVLSEPDIRIVLAAGGALNIDSFGRGAAAPPPGANRGGGSTRAIRKSRLADLSISALRVEDATLHIADRTASGSPIVARHLDFDATNLSAAAPFDVVAKFAFASDAQNASASGTIGPLLKQGVLDASGLPLNLKFTADSVLVERLRKFVDIGEAIPEALSIPDPIQLSGTVQGTIANTTLAATADLTASLVAFGTTFSKPAGTAMRVEANGAWTNKLHLAGATLKLLDLELAASRISLGGSKPASAQLDSNTFNLASIAPMVAPAAKFALTGQGEVHGLVTSGATGASLDASATLKQAAAKLGAEWPAISNFNGKLRLVDGKLAIQPSTFMMGASHINLEGRIESFSPLDASYTIGADTIQLADFIPSRPRTDVVNQVTAAGTARGELSSLLISARVRSGNGTVENIAYQNLDTAAAYKAARVSMHPLSAGVFGGSISGNVDVAAGTQPRFDLTLTMRSIDLEQALRSQGLEVSHKIRGLLSGNIALAGAGAGWDAIKPTLRGSGRVVLANGKLLGVNIVADAINAVAAAPGVSQLVNVAFMSSHHGMLVDPNTELDAASMTFVLAGPRVTTHDLYARSTDYTIRGDGWFDTDKNIDMSGDIQLSLGLKVAIPVTVIGKIPAVIVLPDVPVLAGRIAMGAISTPANVIRGGVNAVGSLVGAGSSSGSSLPSIPNPLDSLKKLIP
jgi:uncharacterized protein involved in outer membrane biogenesis